jgi:hypothetical protein
MTEPARNLGGRPEIGGKIGPVTYGDDLLAAIDRAWPEDGAASRSDWLRNITAAHLNRQAPETIAWTDMSAAGIDIELVEKRRNDFDTSLPMWQATSADGTQRILFGVASDTANVIPEGEHMGWDAGTYDLETEPGNDHPTEHHTGDYYYFEPYDLHGLLALVAKFAPAAQNIL